MISPTVQRILDLVENSGRNNKSICDEIGLAHNAFSEWKKERAKPSADAIVKLANFFNVSTDYLLIGSEEVTRSGIPEMTPEWRDLYLKINQLPESDRYKCIGYLNGYIDRYVQELKFNKLSGNS